MNLSRFKIGTRLSLGFGLIMVFMITLVVLAIVSMKDINTRMDNIIRQNNKGIWHANVIKDSIHTICEAILTTVLTDDDTLKQFENVKILTARATYSEALEKLSKTEKTENGSTLITRLEIAVQALNNIYQKVIQYNGNHKEAVSYYMDTARPYILGLHQICTELVMYEEEQSNLAYNEALKTYNRTFYAFLVLAALTIGIATATALILTKSITEPLSKGVFIANRIAEGDLTVNIDIKTHDETGQLLSSIKDMAHKLKEMKELEYQLFQSQKLETVGRLSGGIAHDFNNMLSVILGNAQLIRMTGGENVKIQERCISIEEAVARAAGFVKQLLAFSRKQTLELKNVDLNNIIGDFEKMIRRMLEKTIEMEIMLSAEPSMVKADVSQINQILLNLAVNAREAMSKGGKLSIKTAHYYIDEEYSNTRIDVAPGEYVAMIVSDNGIGIDKDIAGKIFEPFFTTKESGTGLGLSVVYGIVKQHGGFIDVCSETGVGTTFTVYLPFLKDITESEHHIKASQMMLKGSETILVVEDDAELRNTVSSILQLLGYTIYTAENGVEGLAVFKQHRNVIDLVLLDIVMPKLGGFETLREMKKIDPNVPSIFVTGYNAGNIHHDVSPDDDYNIVQKPYSFENLSQKIRESLDKTSRRAA